MNFYEDIFEMNIDTFQKFQESILIIQNVGSDLSSLQGKIVKSIKLIDSDKKTDAKNELLNMYNLFYSAPKATTKVEALKVICKDEETFETATIEELYDQYERLKKKFLTN